MPYKDPEKKRAANALWYAANKKRIRSEVNEYRKSHLQEVREEERRLYRANRQSKLQSHKRWREANPEAVKTGKKSYVRENKEKVLDQQRQWKKKNKEKIRQNLATWRSENASVLFERYLKKNYKLTRAEYDAMLVNQCGSCALCGQNLDSKVCVDHCHDTGEVRGLIHSECNLLEGMLRRIEKKAGLSAAQLIDRISNYRNSSL